MIIYVVFAVILLFGAAVFVHEFGHYWMARKRGLKVEEFAIGFGPKVFGWKRDGIEYSWRWIPAGGYVKLPQMITSQTLEGGSENPSEPLPPVSPLSKILVAVAGPFMNVVFAFAIATLIYYVGLPVTINPPIVGYVEPNSPESALGIEVGDRIVEVDGQKVDSWEGVQTATVLARTNVVSVVIERNGTNKTYALKTIVSEALGLKVINLDPRDHPVVVQVNSGTPAEAAGLKSGDEIVALEKLPVYGQDHFMKLIQKRAGQSTEITVKRRQEHVTVNVTPKTDPTTGRGIIGIMLSSSAGVVYHVQRPGPTPWAQVEEVWDRTIRTFGALLHSKETGVGAKDLSGPVGIFAMLAAQVSIDYRLALHFMVLLNISLAMINLLPLPVLDGGHIAMSLLEWVRRRPLNVKFVEYATTVFAVVLISFMLYVTFFDLKRFPLWKSLFGREMQIEEPAHGSGTTSNSTSPAR